MILFMVLLTAVCMKIPEKVTTAVLLRHIRLLKCPCAEPKGNSNIKSDAKHPS